MRNTLRRHAPVPVYRLKNEIEYAWYGLRVRNWARGRGEVRVRRPIFMLGCPRSGTTIGGDLFGGHLELSNFSEAGFIWDPRNYFNPRAEHEWTEANVRESDVVRLHQCFEYYRDREGKPRFFNKHPRNSVRIGYILKVFPDATFVHMIRDGRATALSIVKAIRDEKARQKFPFGNFCKPPEWQNFLRDDPLEQAALQWREIIRHILPWRSRLGPSYVEIRYEDFCADPRRALSDAYSSCGLPVEARHLAHVPETLGSRNFKWQERLSQQQKELLLSIQGEQLAALGYLEAR